MEGYINMFLIGAPPLFEQMKAAFEAGNPEELARAAHSLKPQATYMCAGGLPVPDENATKNTVKAGLEMQAFMIARKTERDAANLPCFEMRVGIHTGPVVAGIVGVKKFQYDIWGDIVNTASRMESSGEVGKVNISEATYDLVRTDQDFSFTARGKIEAKGKGVLEMYFETQEE